jgi:hypothetical protein
MRVRSCRSRFSRSARPSLRLRAQSSGAARRRHLIAALGHLRRADESKPYIAKLLSLDPDFSVKHFANAYPFKRASDRRSYMCGLLLAGLPTR